MIETWHPENVQPGDRLIAIDAVGGEHHVIATQQDRILDLFAAGHSLADICDLGHREWTRARVQHVADLHGLTLDAAGRWINRPRSRTGPPPIPAQRRHTDPAPLPGARA